MSSDILNQVTEDGSSGYKAEKGRYHLYVCDGCPFAHRTTIGRLLKGLEDVISLDIVDYILNKETGWKFSPEKEGCTKDTINGKEYLKEVYLMSHPEYSGKITVPVLFDKTTKKIVSNNSGDILRMINSEFNQFCATPKQAALDLYSTNMKKEIDELNGWITPSVVFGVYKVGGASKQSQAAYNDEVLKLFDGIDKIEEVLSKNRFLAGDNITEADIRLFVTLIRFDTVYYNLFFCTKKPLITYKNIWGYIRDIYQTSNIASTVNMKHIKELYYKSDSTSISIIVPVGPELDFNENPGRNIFK